MPTILTPLQYAGSDVLTRAPNAINSQRSETFDSPFNVQAGAHQAPVFDAPDTPLGETRTLSYVCATRADLAIVEDFLSRRAGRRVPFWCPTFRQDAIVLALVTNLVWTIRASAYVTAFPRLAAERNGKDRWIGIGLNGLVTIARTASVVDNGDGTATITNDQVNTSDTLNTAAGTLFSRLELSRLTDDGFTTTYLGGGVAQIDVSVTTAPRETPA